MTDGGQGAALPGSAGRGSALRDEHAAAAATSTLRERSWRAQGAARRAGRGTPMALLATVAALLTLAAGCGKGDRGASPAPPAGAAGAGRDGGGAAAEAPPAAPALLPLGKSDLAGFAYSRGPGKAAFRRGIEAEKAGEHEPCAAAAAAALLADPGHLEAHWLLALALARLGRFDEVGAPLSAAVAGDFLRWGERSLTDEALGAFVAAPQGLAWRALQARYRAAYQSTIAESLLVIGRRGAPWLPKTKGATSINHRSELYAWSPAGSRYLRLSRTDASLVAIVRSPEATAAAYVSYAKVFVGPNGTAEDSYLREVQVGEVELSDGTMSEHEVRLRDVSRLTLHPTAAAHRWYAEVRGRDPAAADQWLLLDVATGKSVAVGEQAVATDGLSVEVGYRRVQAGVQAVSGIEADWDDAGTASALRLARSHKTVTAPPGALFDGRAVAFSPDGSAVVIATAPIDRCGRKPEDRRSSLVLIEVGTGVAKIVAELEGDPTPVFWRRDRLAYVESVDGEPSVRVIDPASGGEIVRLTTEGGVSLQRWVEPAACAPAAIEDPEPGEEGDHEPDRDIAAP